jgi:hypothetical protein
VDVYTSKRIFLNITIVIDENRAPNIELDDEAKALPADELACILQDAIMLLHTHLLTLHSVDEP